MENNKFKTIEDKMVKTILEYVFEKWKESDGLTEENEAEFYASVEMEVSRLTIEGCVELETLIDKESEEDKYAGVVVVIRVGERCQNAMNRLIENDQLTLEELMEQEEE